MNHLNPIIIFDMGETLLGAPPPGGVQLLRVLFGGECEKSVQVVNTLDGGAQLSHYQRNHELPDERLASLTANLLFVEEGEDDGVSGVVVGEDPGQLQRGHDSAAVIIGARTGAYRVPVS